ncbi:hypothetical protein PF005_g9783 [Phytophthora fragariae]|uniref:Uncharacterized protein n=4 Tax=Phytophthora fragariae TaxID=53985 RepID=A0A6A3WK64_9STRA|nr:hypothetical protein PF010_g24865 [Phytophthora fragariae]KAE9181194.1 hypothetical protein PF004_g24623 [Phytophthora fragariae]KAE9186656.1 hypothetical protein PF002_g25815 [Phytophthora fragariae]KAE9214522.1 hypothetical protein PF005_g9783 [Phytophthora fragariae]KAE9279716.1 hypothetical protein PF001_g24586 [Phytophthora fragariae]
MMQAQAGEQIETSVTEKLFNALREVQCESHALITSQANGVNRLETQLSAKIDDGFQTLTSRIQQLIEEQTTIRQHANIDSDKTVELVHELVEKSTTGIYAYVEQSVEIGLQVVREELRQEVCASAVVSTSEPALDVVKHLVAAEAKNSERRIKANMQKALTSFQSDMHLQVQRQVDATSILQDQFQQYRYHAKLKQGSAGDRLCGDDSKELVRKEVDDRMTTLQRQLEVVELKRQAEWRQLQAVERERQAELKTKEMELQTVQRERQAELQTKETVLRQLQAVENAREAELQAKKSELNRGVTEAVAERLRDPVAADISAEIKRSVERSVKTIIDLIRGEVDHYEQTKDEVKTKIENRVSISEDDGDEHDDELSEEDRNTQQRMRDAFIKAQAAITPPTPSLVVHEGGPLLQDGDCVRNKYNRHASPRVVQGRATPSQRVRGGRSGGGRNGVRSGGGGRNGGRSGPHGSMDRQAIVSGLQQAVAERAEAAAQRVHGGRSGGGRNGGRSGPHGNMDRQAIISGLQQEVAKRAEAAAHRYMPNS